MNRYLVLWGGRGSGKSTVVADRLLLKGMKSRRKILCAREILNSIEESVHELLAERILALGLGYFYTVKDKLIVGLNGTRFVYAGLRTNPTKIKSMQGVTDVWVEEAENVTKKSWALLLPTVRAAADGQIYITFNPYSENDESYLRWITNPPANALVIEVNYWDNPFFPEILREMMESDKERDYAEYLWVWEGKTVEQAGTTEFPMGLLQEWDVDEYRGKNWYLLVDPSGSKKKIDGDWTVMSPCGLGNDRNYYFGKWVRDKMSLDEKWNHMVRLNEGIIEETGRGFMAIGYEDSNAGADIDFFQRMMRETGYRLPIVPLKAASELTKVDNIRTLIPIIKQRRMIVAANAVYKQHDGQTVDIRKAFDRECLAFPNITASIHDDILDSMRRINDPALGAIFPNATGPVKKPKGPPMKYDAATRKMVPVR